MAKKPKPPSWFKGKVDQRLAKEFVELKNTGRLKYKAAFFCEHANETPTSRCTCAKDCACREHMCSPHPRKEKAEVSPLRAAQNEQLAQAIYQRLERDGFLFYPGPGIEEGSQAIREELEKRG